MTANVDITGVKLETKRLILRPWEETDLQDLYEYASVDGVGQMAGWEPHKSLDESRMILKMFIDGKKTLAIVLKETGKAIGSVGIEDRDDALPAEFAELSGRELGYVLSRDYWGRGLMPEAVKAVIDYCFMVLHYDFLSCGHFDWNSQSRRVIEKSGFTYLCGSEYKTRTGKAEKALLYILRNPNK